MGLKQVQRLPQKAKKHEMLSGRGERRLESGTAATTKSKYVVCVSRRQWKVGVNQVMRLPQKAKKQFVLAGSRGKWA